MKYCEPSQFISTAQPINSHSFHLNVTPQDQAPSIRGCALLFYSNDWYLNPASHLNWIPFLKHCTALLKLLNSSATHLDVGWTLLKHHRAIFRLGPIQMKLNWCEPPLINHSTRFTSIWCVSYSTSFQGLHTLFIRIGQIIFSHTLTLYFEM